MRSLIDLLNKPYTALAQSSPIDHSQSSTPHLTLDSAPSFTSSSYTQLEPLPCGQLPWNVPTPSFRDHIPDTTDSDSLGFNSISSPSSSEALALSQRTTGTTTSDNLVEDLSALVEQIIREKPTLHQSDHKALRRFTEVRPLTSFFMSWFLYGFTPEKQQRDDVDHFWWNASAGTLNAYINSSRHSLHNSQSAKGS